MRDALTTGRQGEQAQVEPKPDPPLPPMSSAEIGAIAHLYRGEVYRSTIWRTRLDNTTNWSVATLGIALSVTFSSREASPLPLVLVGILIVVFLVYEARRYRYFNVWRARARWLETNFYAPMLRSAPGPANGSWRETLARDYLTPRHHISLVTAIGRRLRRTYVWILAIQALAYFGKVAVHPTPLASFDEMWLRMAVGPISGQMMLLFGIVFNLGWIGFAALTYQMDRKRHKKRSDVAMG